MILSLSNDESGLASFKSAIDQSRDWRVRK